MKRKERQNHCFSIMGVYLKIKCKKVKAEKRKRLFTMDNSLDTCTLATLELVDMQNAARTAKGEIIAFLFFR